MVFTFIANKNFSLNKYLENMDFILGTYGYKTTISESEIKFRRPLGHSTRGVDFNDGYWKIIHSGECKVSVFEDNVTVKWKIDLFAMLLFSLAISIVPIFIFSIYFGFFYGLILI
ncbi:hypothetical protein DMA11_13925 [Marinilabiliaceae bacterium JC017]|nr:hypothetical protein DMA11_13925 [Marinilabiliaceae bacterium JC017]